MSRIKHVFILLLLVIVTAALCGLSYFGFGDTNLGVDKINLGLDLAGGVSIVYEAEEGSNPTSDEMDGALAVIQRRLDSKGYTEASAFLDGADRIRVEIPGVKDASEAVEEIGKTAMLTFVGVDWDELLANDEFMATYYQQYAEASLAEMSEEDQEAADMDALMAEAKDFMLNYPYYAVNLYPGILTDAVDQGLAEVILNGKDVDEATYQYGQYNDTETGAYVRLTMSSEGREKFADGSEKYLNQFIAIRLDEIVCSMPRVNARITDGTAIITGMGGEEEAKELVNDINGGALPVKLVDIQHNSVGATLGQDSMKTSIVAAIIGFILIILFMIIFYKLPGVAAALALTLYVAVELLMLNVLNITLTLSGIAGIILSVGMAVDANVIIFSRINEELAVGRGLRAGVYTGFRKSLTAIIDGNVTTLIVALVLYELGSGTIRGFAQTLALGIVISMFTALVITRLYVNQFVACVCDNPKAYTSLAAMKKIKKA